MQDDHHSTMSNFYSYFDDGYDTPHILPSLNCSNTSARDSAGENAEVLEGNEPHITYPLMLFADFPALPNGEKLQHLLELYQQRIVYGTPFLHSLSSFSTTTASYLVITKALLGSAILAGGNDTESYAQALQRAAFSLLNGCMEIDNSLAREPGWIHAVCLSSGPY